MVQAEKQLEGCPKYFPQKLKADAIYNSFRNIFNFALKHICCRYEVLHMQVEACARRNE